MDFGANEFEKSQAAEKNAIEVLAGDRVCVMNASGSLVKGRVKDKSIEGDHLFVTLSKTDEAVAYPRNEVYVMYRYVKTPFGEVVVPLCLQSQNK